MFLSNPFSQAFGLDIGDLSIKLMQLRRQTHFRRPPSFSIAAIRSVRLPPGLIVNGEIEQPELVRKKILYLLGRTGPHRLLRSPWVVAGLPEPKTFLKLIDIPAPSAEILDDDVIFHAKKHLPFELEDTYVDWQIISSASDENKTAVLVAAVPKTIADSYTYLLEAAGLTPLALEVEGLALARALITQDKDYAGVARALLDIGATRSSLLIYDQDSVQFSSTLSFSGELVTTAIAQHLKIDYTEAERLKIKNGLRYDPEHPTYLTVVNELVQQFIGEIKKAVLFYKEHAHAPNPVTHITMSGGASLMANMSAVISYKLGISANPGNAWKNLGITLESSTATASGTALAAAIGLSLRAAAYPFPI